MKNRYYDEFGRVGVIYMSSYGLPWSARDQNDQDFAEFKRFNPELVEAILQKKSVEDVRNIFTKYGYKLETYEEATIDSLKVKFVPKKSVFVIDDHDGCETLKFISQFDWNVA